MKKNSSQFSIPFVGLKHGKHSYEFELSKAFFEQIKDALIEDGDLKAELILEKKETMLIGHYSIEGTVIVPCDRCNDPIKKSIHGEFRIVYKFGEGNSEDENLVILARDAYELEVADPFYELIIVSLPSRIVHPEGECNPEVMKLYNAFIVNANEPEDEWDDEDWDEEDWEDDDFDEDDDEEDDSEDLENPEDNNDKPIDPRWSILKNLN